MKKRNETTQQRIRRLLKSPSGNTPFYWAALKLLKVVPSDAYFFVQQNSVGFGCDRLHRQVSFFKGGTRLRGLTVAGQTIIPLDDKDGITRVRAFFSPAAALQSKKENKKQIRAQKIEEQQYDADFKTEEALKKTLRGRLFHANASEFSSDVYNLNLYKKQKELLASLQPTLNGEVYSHLQFFADKLAPHWGFVGERNSDARVFRDRSARIKTGVPYSQGIPTPQEVEARRKELLAVAAKIGWPSSRLCGEAWEK